MRPTSIGSILNKLANVHKITGGWQADCPCQGHDTPKNHLSVKDAGDKALVTYFGSHSYEDICQALGFESLTYNQTAPTPVLPQPIQAKPTGPRRLVCTYDYRDEKETLLYQVCRWSPKSFSQRRPDGKGGWITGPGCLDGVRRVPFMLPEILKAIRDRDPILIPEGEKDVLTLWNIGLIATTNSEGAGKWHTEFGDLLAGGKITVIPDNDPAGRGHAKQVLDSFSGKAKSSKVLEIPPSAKDVTEWLEQGGDWIQFDELIAGAFVYRPGEWPKAQLTVCGGVPL